MIFSMMLKPIDYVLEVLMVYMTRQNEFAADKYSVN